MTAGCAEVRHYLMCVYYLGNKINRRLSSYMGTGVLTNHVGVRQDVSSKKIMLSTDRLQGQVIQQNVAVEASETVEHHSKGLSGEVNTVDP